MSPTQTLTALDVERIRRDFPITREMTYFDNAGVVPPPQPVLDAMTASLADYSRGGVCRFFDLFEEVVAGVQSRFGTLVGAEPEAIAPVAYTSEAVNIVANMIDFAPGDSVVTNDLEYPSNFYPWVNLQRRGVEVRVARNRGGVLGVAEIEPLVDARTRVITATSVAWLNGLRLDVASVARFARDRGIYTMLDATQAAGALRVDVRELGVDFLACSGLKWLLGPTGVGVFYCRRDLIDRFHPAYVSRMSIKDRHAPMGPHLELAETARRFMLSINLDLAAYQGFVVALDYLLRIGLPAIEGRVLSLTDRLIAGLGALGLEVTSPLGPGQRSAILTFLIPDPDRVVEELSRQKIRVVRRGDAIRVSPHFYNSEAEIDRLLEALASLTP